MRKQLWYALFILALLSVGVVSAAMKEGYGRSTPVPKYKIHWAPAAFDGTSSTCKFGILQKNYRGEAVCTHRRGHAGIMDALSPVVDVPFVPVTNETGNETG